MLSLTPRCNMDPSFHECGFLAINYSTNGTRIAYLLPIKVPLTCLSIQIIWTVTPLFVTATAKHPTLINSMISCRTKDPESSTNSLPNTQIGHVILNNTPQIFPTLLLYTGLANSFGRYYPSNSSILNKTPINLQQIVWYSLPNFQGFQGKNINPRQL